MVTSPRSVEWMTGKEQICGHLYHDNQEKAERLRGCEGNEEAGFNFKVLILDTPVIE